MTAYCYNTFMELSERYMQKFEEEGFTSVYEWQDEPGTVYPTRTHKGKVSLFVTDGSIEFDFSGKKKTVVAGQRLDIPVDSPHSAVVGPDGWIVIIGEEVKDDW